MWVITVAHMASTHVIVDKNVQRERGGGETSGCVSSDLHDYTHVLVDS